MKNGTNPPFPSSELNVRFRQEPTFSVWWIALAQQLQLGHQQNVGFRFQGL